MQIYKYGLSFWEVITHKKSGMENHAGLLSLLKEITI